MTNKKVDLTLGSMVMVSKFSNIPDELSENDELREYELSGSDCKWHGEKVIFIYLLVQNVEISI